MKFLQRLLRTEQRSIGGDMETVRVFGLDSVELPAVTGESAMTVPAVAAAISFLSAALAGLPIHVFNVDGEDESVRDRGDFAYLLNQAPNEEWSSYAARRYFWSQVFGKAGRGLLYIERTGPDRVAGFWPMNAEVTTVRRVNGRKEYVCEGKVYQAREVIDVPFLLKADQLSTYSPIWIARKSIALAIAMGDYAAKFFAGGGVPPLSLTGPMPAGPDAIRRAQADIRNAIDAARRKGEAVFPIPPGYELKTVGFDPDKGQMTDARRFQVEELARTWNLPPVFLQDLTNGSFANTEQQDLFLVKHNICGWAKAFEDEVNLKCFAASRGRRYAEHNLDALQRGDLKSRMEALARGVQTSLLTPNEARSIDNRAPLDGGDKLYMQGATVPLGQYQAGLPSKPQQGDPEDAEN